MKAQSKLVEQPASPNMK